LQVRLQEITIIPTVRDNHVRRQRAILQIVHGKRIASLKMPRMEAFRSDKDHISGRRAGVQGTLATATPGVGRADKN
jgi:hypothetical protein